MVRSKLTKLGAEELVASFQFCHHQVVDIGHVSGNNSLPFLSLPVYDQLPNGESFLFFFF